VFVALLQTVVVLEFFGGCVMCMVMMWRTLHESLLQRRASLAVVIGVSSAVVLPTVWVRQFSQLAFISLLGFVTAVLSTLVMCGEFLVRTSAVHDHRSVGAVAVAVASLVLSVTLNACGRAAIESLAGLQTSALDLEYLCAL
jgi:hypothetical protein